MHNHRIDLWGQMWIFKSQMKILPLGSSVLESAPLVDLSDLSE